MTQIKRPEKSSSRLIIMILVFFVLITATIIIMRPLDLAVRSNMREIRDGFIKTAESFLGRKIEYGYMSPSIFGTLDIHDLYIRRDDHSPILSISRLRISYSLFSLIRGKINEGFKSVTIDRPVLDIDLSRDRDILNLFSGGNFSSDTDSADIQKNILNLLPENFQIRIRNGEWETRGDPGQISIHNFNLDGSIKDSRIVFSSRWNITGAINTGSFSFLDTRSISVSSNGRANGDFNLHLTDGSGTVEIPSLRGDSFRLEPISLGILLRNKNLEIRKVYDKTPADFAMLYDMENKNVSLNFSGDNFSPRELISLTGSWRDYNSFTAMRLSGQANVEINEEGMRYVMDLWGLLPQVFDFRNISFGVKADGDENKVDIEDIFFYSSGRTISYTGSLGLSSLGSQSPQLHTFAPEGVLSVSNLTLLENDESNKGISGQFHISSRGREIQIWADNFSSGTVLFSALDASVYMEDFGLNFICSAVRSQTSGFSLQGSVDYRPWYMETSLKLNNLSLLDIADFLGPAALIPSLPEISRPTLENIHITTELFFTADNQHSLYNAPEIALVLRSEKLADFSLSGTDRRFELNQGTIFWAGNSAQMSGFIDLNNTRDISVSVEISYKDLVYYARGVILDGHSVSLYGSYGFEVFFSSAGTMGYSGYIKGDHIPLPSGENYAHLSFLASARYDSPSFWSVDLDLFEIAGLSVPSSASTASFTLSGTADQNGVYITPITYSDNEPLAGNLSVTWDRLYNNFDLNLGLNNNEMSEHYSLDGSFGRDYSFDFNLTAENAQLARFSKKFTNGTAAGNLRVFYNTSESLKAELFVTSVVFQWQDRMINASARASLDNAEFFLQDFRLLFGSSLQAEISELRVNREQGIAQTAARLWGTAAGRAVDFSLRGQADFASPDTWLGMINIPDAINGSLVFDRAQYDTMQPEEPFEFILSSKKDETGQVISLDGGPRNMARLRYTPESSGGGNFYLALSAPSPVRGSFTGFIDSKTIDMRIPDLYVDAGAFWKFMPQQAMDIILFPAGILTASLHITGPLRDPEFYGTARASSFRIQVPDYIPVDIRPVPVSAVLDGNDMRFGPITATAGNGMATVTAWYQFEQWIPLVFSMDFDIEPDDAVPFAFDIGGLVSNGRASGHLNLAMENKTFTVSGDLTAQNSVITINSSELTSFRASNDQSDRTSIVIDLVIRSGRQVEFYWPSVEVPILHAQADQGAGVRINSDLISRRFSFTGDVNLRSGEIFYLERNFYLRQGTLFFNENETRFEPRISARAEIRDQTDDGPVTIALVIDNSPLMSFSARFESNPPLSQNQILSLLGQSQSGNSFDSARDAGAILSFTADALTQFTVMPTIQRVVRNFLGLDMFNIRTQVLQNVVLQAAGFQNNADSSFRAGNIFDNTTIFMGKYIGSNIFVESLLSLKYDPLKTSWSGLSFQPEIGVELRNPLFDIKMNMLLLHPENWFINDITFSLLWRRSF